MYIRTNMPLICATRIQQQTAASLTKVNEKLALGFRVNRAGDDAASLALSENMRFRIRMLSQAERNANEGMNLAQTADGALSEINSILQRARMLCEQAAGGTMNDQGRTAVSQELNELFAEVDRITASTCFNEIRLFRRKAYEREDMEYGPRFTYQESVEVFDPGHLEEWGDIDFISAENFDPAPKAKAASKTFRLNDSIQGVGDLVGKGFQFQSKKGKNYIDHTVYFKYRDSDISREPDSFEYTCIELEGCATVDDALKKMVSTVNSKLSYYCEGTRFANLSYDENTGTVTFMGRTEQATELINVDNQLQVRPYNVASHFSSAWSEAPSNLLGLIDGYGSFNNGPYYSNYRTYVNGIYEASKKFTTEDECKRFRDNSLNVGGSVISLSDIACTIGMTYGEFYQKVADKINSETGLKADYISASNNIGVRWENTDKLEKLRISENYPRDIIEEKDLGTMVSEALSLTIQKTVTATAEAQESWELTLPDALPSGPFSLNISPIGGTSQSYVFYDSSKNSKPTGSVGSNVIQTPSNVIFVDIKDKDTDGVQELLKGYIQQEYWGAGLYMADVVRSGNKLTITARYPGTPLDLDQHITSQEQTITWKERKVIAQGAAIFKTDRVYNRDVSATFSLGSGFDKSKLAGTGFVFNAIGGWAIEFVDGPGKELRPSNEHYDVVDISGFNSFDDLSRYLNSKTIYQNTIWIDQSDPNDVKLVCKSFQKADQKYDFSSAYVADGFIPLEYLFDDKTAVYSQGMSDGYSQKMLDFSSINEKNLDSLLGKGFRVNCATCAGEYVNVFFCWENVGGKLIPESFEHKDASTGGQTRTIHNVVVELSKVQRGSGIVQNIVDQVQGQLRHYIEMKADPNNPGVLIAKERRRGDVLAYGSYGSLMLASVQSGVKANFHYTAKAIPVDYSLWVGSGEPPEGYVLSSRGAPVEIYVGKGKNLEIRLPYLDLPMMDLDAPGGKVDLNDSSQDLADWMKRVEHADQKVVTARGAIGADYNRLEHAVSSLRVENGNLTEAESRIRDTDVAKETVERTRLQILLQAQQSLLAQANAQSGNVVRMLQ